MADEIVPPGEIPLAPAAPPATPPVWHGPAPVLDVRIPESIPLIAYRGRWSMGLFWLLGLIVGLLGMLLILASLLLGSPIGFAFLFFLAVLDLACVRWISKWSGWGIWLVAVVLAGPIWIIGVLGVFYGSFNLLAYGLGLILTPGCF